VSGQANHLIGVPPLCAALDQGSRKSSPNYLILLLNLFYFPATWYGELLGDFAEEDLLQGTPKLAG
jgi:hypothetical protein